MKTGWVIAMPSAAAWEFRIVQPSGEVTIRHGDDPALATRLLEGDARIGLVIGHADAPLVAAPADPVKALSGIASDGAWRILPRFSQSNPLMLSAGEEVLLAGALSIAPKFDGTILIRGAAHALWAQISAGEVVSIQGSAAPGLRATLAPGSITDVARVTGAAAETLSRPERLAALIASLPARRRMQAADARGADDGAACDLVAGWLFGADLAAAKAWWLGQPIMLISDQADGAAEVLAAQGVTPHILPPGAALLAGLKTIAPL